jgi:hypothetical protein
MTTLTTILALLLAATPALAAEDLSTCMENAQKQSLTPEQSLRLCQPAERFSQVDCFKQANVVHGLSKDAAISLCQCDSSSHTAQCASQVLHDAKLNKDEMRSICKDPKLNDLTTGACGTGQVPPATDYSG